MPSLQVTPAPIDFTTQGHVVEVVTDNVALTVDKHMVHDPTCGAMQWFHAFVPSADAAMGVALQHSFTGPGLGTKWSDPNKRSAFFGSFSY